MVDRNTSVIRLRKLIKEDYPALAKQANNKKIWLNLRNVFPHPYSEEDAKNFISLAQGDEKNHRFAIIYKDAFAGMVGIFPQDDVYAFNAEIGYWIGEEFWGKGIGTEAVKLVCEFAFTETEIRRVFAGIFDYNKGSVRVLEKNGFEFEGVGRQAVFKDGAFYDELRYGRVKGMGM